MIKAITKFHERDLSNFFVLASAAKSGAILTRDTTDVSVVGVGDRSYGKVVAGSVAVAGDREMGFLFYPVVVGGPTLFQQLTNTLNYSVDANSPVAIWTPSSGAILETDAYATGIETGAIVAGAASGNTGLDTLLGIIGGKYVLIQETGDGSVPRARLIGNGVNSGNDSISAQCIRVMVL